MNWKVTSEKIAERHKINTFDKLSYAQAKEIGFCYCVLVNIMILFKICTLLYSFI